MRYNHDKISNQKRKVVSHTLDHICIHWKFILLCYTVFHGAIKEMPGGRFANGSGANQTVRKLG